MHDLRKIAVAEPWGTEGNLARPNEYSIHMEVRTLYARRMFREKSDFPRKMILGKTLNMVIRFLLTFLPREVRLYSLVFSLWSLVFSL